MKNVENPTSWQTHGGRAGPYAELLRRLEKVGVDADVRLVPSIKESRVVVAERGVLTNPATNYLMAVSVKSLSPLIKGAMVKLLMEPQVSKKQFWIEEQHLIDIAERMP